MEIANQHCTGWETATESSMVSWAGATRTAEILPEFYIKNTRTWLVYGASTS